VSNSELSVLVRFLLIVLTFGLGWIFGFVVRWGIHEYYVDPLGHCTSPTAYRWEMSKNSNLILDSRYDPSMAEAALETISYAKIRSFFEDFTLDDHHLPGSQVSHLSTK